MLPELTLSTLKAATTEFAKAVGTYVEQKFRRYLEDRFTFVPGNSANGVDFPELGVDMKATSVTQPQSSSPFKNAHEKVYGLGYHLLVFVYRKTDDDTQRSAHLDIKHVIYVDMSRTADYQTTYGIAGILERQGNKDDLVAFLEERNLPLDEIGREALAERILHEQPNIGYLTISNALQWRLQYSRAIQQAGKVDGIENLNV